MERMNPVAYIQEDGITKEASVVSTLTPETHEKQNKYEYEKQQEQEEFT